MRRRVAFSVFAPLVVMASVHVAEAANVCLQSTTKNVVDYIVISDPKPMKVGETVPIVGSVLEVGGAVVPFSGSALRTNTNITVSVLVASLSSLGGYHRLVLTWQAADDSFAGYGGMDLPPLFDFGFDLDLELVTVSCSSVPAPAS